MRAPSIAKTMRRVTTALTLPLAMLAGPSLSHFVGEGKCAAASTRNSLSRAP